MITYVSQLHYKVAFLSCDCGSFRRMKIQSRLDETARDARETAEYMEGLARDLRRLAATADLGFLAYLLAMVEDDAAATVRRLQSSEDA